MQLGTTWRYSDLSIHAGYDYPVPIGTTARAMRDGVVLDMTRDEVKKWQVQKDGVEPGTAPPTETSAHSRPTNLHQGLHHQRAP